MLFSLKLLLSADLLPRPSWNSIFSISSMCPLLKNKQVLTVCLLTISTRINPKTAHIQFALDIQVDQQIRCFPFHPVIKKISVNLTFMDIDSFCFCLLLPKCIWKLAKLPMIFVWLCTCCPSLPGIPCLPGEPVAPYGNGERTCLLKKKKENIYKVNSSYSTILY